MSQSRHLFVFLCSTQEVLFLLYISCILQQGNCCNLVLSLNIIFQEVICCDMIIWFYFLIWDTMLLFPQLPSLQTFLLSIIINLFTKNSIYISYNEITVPNKFG